MYSQYPNNRFYTLLRPHYLTLLLELGNGKGFRYGKRYTDVQGHDDFSISHKGEEDCNVTGTLNEIPPYGHTVKEFSQKYKDVV